jgi:hypothetical protein
MSDGGSERAYIELSFKRFLSAILFDQLSSNTLDLVHRILDAGVFFGIQVTSIALFDELRNLRSEAGREGGVA